MKPNRKILAAIRKAGHPLTLDQIHDSTRLRLGTISRTLSRMRSIAVIGDGRFYGLKNRYIIRRKETER